MEVRLSMFQCITWPLYAEWALDIILLLHSCTCSCIFMPLGIFSDAIEVYAWDLATFNAVRAIKWRCGIHPKVVWSNKANPHMFLLRLHSWNKIYVGPRIHITWHYYLFQGQLLYGVDKEARDLQHEGTSWSAETLTKWVLHNLQVRGRFMARVGIHLKERSMNWVNWKCSAAKIGVKSGRNFFFFPPFLS